MKRKIALFCSAAATAGALFCSGPQQLPRTLLSLVSIIVLVTAICIVAGILEYRCILHKLSSLAAPLMRFSRLPAPCSLSFVAAFASGNVAALMLAENYREKTITRREMICGALCNSVPSVFMFNGYLALPVIGMLGMIGISYFLITFGVMGLALVIFLLIARLGGKNEAQIRIETPAVLSWRETGVKVRIRSTRFFFRLLLLTTPFYLWTACALQRGWLDFSAPPGWEAFLSPGALSVFASRVGGLLASAGTAAELLRQQEITAGQLLIALLAGNVLNGITRMIRRGVPVSLGIYPGGDGVLIAVAGAGTRILLTVVAILIIWRTVI